MTAVLGRRRSWVYLTLQRGTGYYGDKIYYAVPSGCDAEKRLRTGSYFDRAVPKEEGITEEKGRPKRKPIASIYGQQKEEARKDGKRGPKEPRYAAG
jgi:hypothetical protein